jgi:hypothetical protein
MPGYHYNGYPDALKCAVALSNTEVISIGPVDYSCGSFFDVSRYAEKLKPFNDLYFGKFGNDPLAWIRGHSLMRWFCIGMFCQDQGIDTPIFAPDWDMLIFQDMREAEARMDCYDFSVGLAALHIKHPSLLMMFYGMAMECVREGKEAFPDVEHAARRRTGNATWSDMEIWEVLRSRVGLKKVTVTEVKGGSVFDDIIQVLPGESELELDETDVHAFSKRVSKRIVWEGGRPHFVIKDSGRLVKANTIHCWGNYKMRTAELLKKAGL